MRIISFGFVKNGEHSYLRDKLNFIDFTCLVTAVTYLIFNGITLFSVKNTQNVNLKETFQYLKIIRIIRAFRLIGLSETLQVILI